MKKFQVAMLAGAVALVLAGCDDDDDDNGVTLESLDIACVTPVDADPVTGSDVSLSVVGTYVSGNEFDTASAEIVSYDSCSDKLYVVNAEDQTVDVLTLAAGTSAPSKAAESDTIDLQAAAEMAGIAIGSANSVSAKQGLVAVAIEADTKQDPGLIALYRSDDLSLLNVYTAGALPDMVTLTDDASAIIAANEGEPSGDYSNDPEGSVTIVDISDGIDDEHATISQVSFVDFNSDGSRAGEAEAAGVRIPGPEGTTVAQDLEPEYLTVAGGKAYVALQENNALAVVDIASASVDALVGLGTKRWDAASGNQLDLSNKDDEVGAFESYEQLVGYYMPDTITSYTLDDTTYLVTANEGDGREYVYETTQELCDDAEHEWDGDEFQPGGDDEDPVAYTTEMDDCISFTDEGRGDDLNVAEAHPLYPRITDGDDVGRIKVIMDDEDVAADEDVFTFGARSFTIWDTAGNVVFDSGDTIAQQVFAVEPDNFNSTNDSNDSADSRSDDKGSEPEAVEVAIIDDRVLVFVGLERQGGVMVFDATDAANTEFAFYINNRDFSADVCTTVDDGDCDDDTYNEAALDLAPESIDYFTREGAHFIAVGNEVSGTTTVYQIEFN